MEKQAVKTIDDNLEFAMISQGNTAEVYLYNNTKILKLFRQGIPFELVSDEYKVVEAVASKLNNVPKVFDIVLYKARYGIIYECINGIDMIKAMLGKIYKIKLYSKSLALLHSEIHKADVDIHCDVKEKLCANIDAVAELSKLEKDKIKLYLNTLPTGNSLCHFDFHPGNVMIQDNSYYIIDWMTACNGNPNADAARTFLLLQFGELQHVNLFLKAVAHIFEKHIGKIYCREYKRITGISDCDIEQWMLPVAAARLVEWITDSEKKKLLKLIREKLSFIKDL